MLSTYSWTRAAAMLTKKTHGAKINARMDYDSDPLWSERHTRQPQTVQPCHLWSSCVLDDIFLASCLLYFSDSLWTFYICSRYIVCFFVIVVHLFVVVVNLFGVILCTTFFCFNGVSVDSTFLKMCHFWGDFATISGLFLLVLLHFVTQDI